MIGYEYYFSSDWQPPRSQIVTRLLTPDIRDVYNMQIAGSAIEVKGKGESK